MESEVKSFTKTKKQISTAAVSPTVIIPAPDVANHHLMVSLTDKLPIDEIIAALRECLTATKTEYRRDGPVEAPDQQTRLNAIKLALAYHVGLPIQRQEIAYRKEVDTTDLRAKLKKPGFAEAMIREFWPELADDMLRVLDG